MADLQNFFRGATSAAQGGTTTHTQASVQENANPAQMTASYPRAGLSSRTPEADQRMRTKMQMMDPNTGRTPFGTVMATDADFKILEQKRKLVEEANFDAWLGQNFHKGDVTSRKWLQEVVPDYYDAREKEIDDRAEFAKMVSKIKLRGPKTTEEMVLVYGLSEGKIELQPGWNVIGYVEPDANGDKAASAAALNNRFLLGLMGPMRYQDQATRKSRAESQFANARGQRVNLPAGSENPFGRRDGTGAGSRFMDGPSPNARADFDSFLADFQNLAV